MPRDLSRNVLSQSLESRIAARIEVASPDDCWEWIGARTKYGYGRVGIGRSRTEYAHRLSFMLAYDEDIPAGMHIMHKCDNPPCCNPSHLTIGTASDNAQDRENKGRRPYPPSVGTHHPEIIELYESGMTCKEIGKIFDVSAPTVWTWLRKYGVQMRSRWGHVSATPVGDSQEIATLYEGGYSLREIARGLAVSPETARRRLVECGVIRRKDADRVFRGSDPVGDTRNIKT